MWGIGGRAKRPTFYLSTSAGSLRLQQDIIDIKESIAHLGLVLDYLAKRRDAWKQAERETRGLCPLEAEITSIKAQHKAYRAEFKSPSAIARRRAEHRASWIQEHRRDSPPS